MVVRHCSGNLADAIGLLASPARCLAQRGLFSLSLDKCAASRRFLPLRASSSASSPTQNQPSRTSANSPQTSSKSRRSANRAFLEETVDKDGYLCSPRAARELAFSVLYAGLVSGQKPMRIFRDRLKQRSGHFAKDLLARYKHAPDDEDSVIAEDDVSAKKLEHDQQESSLLEAAVLSAPPTQVYSQSILMLAQEIIQVTVDSWSEYEIILRDLLPKSWKEPGGSAAAQQCILHMSMAEMAKCGTSPKIAINEAVELGKRFSDHRAARIINGCLGHFTRSEYYKECQVARNELITSELNLKGDSRS
eukprot:c15295_g1_i1 orf=75-992(+)